MKRGPFYFKTVSADCAYYWTNLVYSLFEGAPQELRPTARKGFTSRIGKNQQYEIVPTDKRDPNRTPLFTDQQKAETTPAQSLTYANSQNNYLPSAFMKDKSKVLVGITTPTTESEGIYTRRICRYDLLTLSRTFEGKSKEELAAYLENRISIKDYHTTLESLEETAKVDQSHYNEVMARIRWVENNDSYNIMIFEDNVDSRILAQARALDIHFAVVARRKQQGLLSDGWYAPNIIFYPSLTEYSKENQERDRTLNDSVLSEAISSIYKVQPLSIDQRIEYLTKYGDKLSRNLNYQLMGTSIDKIFNKDPNLKKNPYYPSPFFVYAVDALPVDEIVRRLKNPESDMDHKIISIFTNDLDKLGSLMYRMKPDDWEALLNSPAVLTELTEVLKQYSDLTNILLKLPKTLWGRLLSISPFSKTIDYPDQNQNTSFDYACDAPNSTYKGEMIEAILKARVMAIIEPKDGKTTGPYSITSNMSFLELCAHYKVSLQSFILTNTDLFGVLQTLPAGKRMDFYNQFSKTFLATATYDDCYRIFKILPLADHAEFLKPIPGGITTLVYTLNDLSEVLDLSEDPVALCKELGRETVCQLMEEIFSLKLILYNLSESQTRDFLSFLGPEYFKLLFIPCFDRIFEIFDCFTSSSDRLEFIISMGTQYLTDNITSITIYSSILRSLSYSDQGEFIDFFGDSLLTLVKSHPDLEALLENLPDSFKPEILAKIGVPFLVREIHDNNYTLKIKNGAELGLILRVLPSADWGDFLRILGPISLSNILPDGKHLFVMLSKVPENSIPTLMIALKDQLKDNKVTALIENNEPHIKEMLKDILRPAEKLPSNQLPGSSCKG